MSPARQRACPRISTELKIEVDASPFLKVGRGSRVSRSSHISLLRAYLSSLSLFWHFLGVFKQGPEVPRGRLLDINWFLRPPEWLSPYNRQLTFNSLHFAFFLLLLLVSLHLPPLFSLPPPPCKVNASRLNCVVKFSFPSCVICLLFLYIFFFFLLLLLIQLRRLLDWSCTTVNDIKRISTVRHFWGPSLGSSESDECRRL